MTPAQRAQAINDANWTSADDLMGLIEMHINAAVEQAWWDRFEPVLHAVALRAQYIVGQCRGEEEMRAEAQAIIAVVEKAIDAPPLPS